MGKVLEIANEIFYKMYEGERDRDASSTIRGFLFQDLVAISELLKEDTERIFVEYIEDILVVKKDTTYIIQAKYYPKGNVKKKEIIRELYYQYLCLTLLGYKSKVIPILAVYSPVTSKKLTLEKMKEKYIEKDEESKPEIPENIADWLKEYVYPLDKEEAETKCFQEYAWNQNMQDFLDVLEIISDYKGIKDYRENVADELGKLNMQGCLIDDFEKRKNIMLGLAVQYIHTKYNDNLTEKERECQRKDFVEYLEKNLCTDEGKCIGAYLNSVVIECWEDIQNVNTQMTEEQENMLACIRDNTMKWLSELCSTVDGQYRLLYTVSNKTKEKLQGYCSKRLSGRYEMVCEHYDAIKMFLKYFWKIIMNINQDLLKENVSEEERERLTPQYYINQNETKYISIHFPEDIVNKAAILAQACGSMREDYLTNIFGRMQSVRPEKWYIDGETKGRYSYDLDVTEIIDRKKVSSIEPETFHIECMKCINISGRKWHLRERCEENIFSEKCVEDKPDEVE